MTTETRHMRFHAPLAKPATPFGPGWFGGFGESTARFLGTPAYLITQTVAVIVWIVLNATGTIHWDDYPFILLNLGFSLQAAYAAPMILLAETRQADRDKHWSEADALHRETLATTTLQLLEQNTDLTREVEDLSRKVHELTVQIYERVLREP